MHARAFFYSNSKDIVLLLTNSVLIQLRPYYFDMLNLNENVSISEQFIPSEII